MITKIDMWLLANHNLEGQYKLDYEGDIAGFTVSNAVWLVREAKRKFHLPGKTFVVFANNTTFLVTRLHKEWTGYAYSFPAQESEV